LCAASKKVSERCGKFLPVVLKWYSATDDGGRRQEAVPAALVERRDDEHLCPLGEEPQQMTRRLLATWPKGDQIMRTALQLIAAYAVVAGVLLLFPAWASTIFARPITDAAVISESAAPVKPAVRPVVPSPGSSESSLRPKFGHEDVPEACRNHINEPRGLRLQARLRFRGRSLAHGTARAS
jgi:hypothetical protein